MSNLARSLSFGISFGINDKQLTRADKKVDKFKAKVMGTENNFKGMSNAADMAGSKTAKSFTKAGREAGQFEGKVIDAADKFKRVGKSANVAGNKTSSSFSKSGNKVVQFKSKVKSADTLLERISKTAKRTGSNISKGFSKASKSAGKMMNTLKNNRLELGVGATAGASLIFKSALDASSKNELMNKFKVSFGQDNYREILGWSNNYADSVARGRNATLNWLANSQDLISSFSDNKKAAAEMSKRLVKLGVDLSSFQNKKTKNVMGNLLSGMMGETQALKSLGIGITADQVKTKAYKMGLAKAGSEVSRFAKMQATLALAYERSKNAIGDAERTNKSFANQLKFLKGNLSDISSEVGKNYVPSLGGALTKTNKWLLSLKNSAQQGNKTSKVIAKLIAGGTGILGLATALGTLGIVIPKVWGGLNNVYGAFSKLTGINGKVIKSFVTARWQTAKLGSRLAWLRTKAIGSYIKGQAMARWATLKTGASMIWAKSKAVASFSWSLIKQGAKSAYVFAASLIKSAIPAVGSFASGLYVSAASAIPTLGSNLLATTTATWGFTTALLANPITWIVGGIIGLGVAIYELSKHWDTATSKFSTGFNWIKERGIAFFGWFKGILQKTPNWLEYMITPWSLVTDHFDTAKNKLGAGLNWLENEFTNVKKWISNKLNIGAAIEKSIQSSLDTLPGWLKSPAKKILSFVGKREVKKETKITSDIPKTIGYSGINELKVSKPPSMNFKGLATNLENDNQAVQQTSQSIRNNSSSQINIPVNIQGTTISKDKEEELQRKMRQLAVEVLGIKIDESAAAEGI